jgi:hypothetical protein
MVLFPCETAVFQAGCGGFESHLPLHEAELSIDRLLDAEERCLDSYFIVLVFPILVKYSSGINSGFLYWI